MKRRDGKIRLQALWAMAALLFSSLCGSYLYTIDQSAERYEIVGNGIRFTEVVGEGEISHAENNRKLRKKGRKAKKRRTRSTRTLETVPKVMIVPSTSSTVSTTTEPAGVPTSDAIPAPPLDTVRATTVSTQTPTTARPSETASTAAPRAGGSPAPDLSCQGWKLAFVDNFDRPLDPANWNVYDYPGHNNNGLRHPSAVTVNNGLLTITAKEVDGTIISGGLGTRHSQTYGRFEVRVRADPDPNGITSAVVLTWPASNNWPAEGENNIFETGPEPSRQTYSSFVHYPDGTDGGTHVDYLHQASGTQWREMVMEWGPDKIRIWRDGQLSMNVDDAGVIPDFAHVMTVQLDAMRTAPFKGQTRMEVDWVRIYKPIDPPRGC